jgi:hypothetical protein
MIKHEIKKVESDSNTIQELIEKRILKKVITENIR